MSPYRSSEKDSFYGVKIRLTHGDSLSYTMNQREKDDFIQWYRSSRNIDSLSYPTDTRPDVFVVHLDEDDETVYLPWSSIVFVKVNEMESEDDYDEGEEGDDYCEDCNNSYLECDCE